MRAWGAPARGPQRQPVRALNPLAPSDRRLLTAIQRPEYHLQGFRNEHILRELLGNLPPEPRERKRHAARLRRQFLILRGHGLLRRIPSTRRYRLTERGLHVIPALLYYATEGLPLRLMRQAA
jgi:hypothetical protein